MPRSKGYALLLDDQTEKLWMIKVRPRFSWDGGVTATVFKDWTKKFSLSFSTPFFVLFFLAQRSKLLSFLIQLFHALFLFSAGFLVLFFLAQLFLFLQEKKKVWARQESDLRPPPCEGGVLPLNHEPLKKTWKNMVEGSLKRFYLGGMGHWSFETHVSISAWVSFKYLLVKYFRKLLPEVIGMDFREELTFQEDEEDFDSDGDSDEDFDSEESDE